MVLLVGAALTITMAGVRAASGIISMVFLALILTITVHPVRAWLRRKGVPSIVTSVIMLVAVYLILIVVILMLVVSIGRLATLLPTYTPRYRTTSTGSVSGSPSRESASNKSTP